MTPMEYINMAAYIVAIGAAVATVTPNKKDDAFWRRANKVINIIGFNFGRAKNKE